MHESAAHLPVLAASVLSQLRGDDELVLIDNASADGSAEAARRLFPRARVCEAHANRGFAGGCHAGARASAAPLLLFLNPDCEPQPGSLDLLRRAAEQHPSWAAWQPAILIDRERINASGGVVHFLGFGWAGDCEQPISERPSADREIAFPSGAAMVVRREAWRAMGGMDPAYFMYGEDLDFGLRLWLSGRRCGMVAQAKVIHHGYRFEKGPRKWLWLERNRWRTVLSTYPLPLLLVLAPALMAAEIGLLAIAARGGWLATKLRAQAATLAALPDTLARRRALQAGRAVDACDFACRLTASLQNPHLPATSGRWLTISQAAYWAVARRALAGARAPDR